MAARRVEYQTRAVQDESGNMLSYEGVVINVSARKQAEEAFQLAYLLLQSTMDAVREAILVTDLHGFLIMANKAARDLFGAGLEEGMKIPAEGFDAPHTPYARFLQDKGAHSGEMRLGKSDSFFLAEVAPYHTPEGTVIGAVHTLRRLSGVGNR